MQILITGGGGFLGEYVTREILKRPHFILTNFSRHNYSQLEDLGVPTIQGDLRSKTDLENAFRKGHFEAVIHLAALTSNWGKKEDLLATNLLGTQNLIEVAKQFSVKKFLFITPSHQFITVENSLGSNEALSYPQNYLNTYFESKALAEKFVLSVNDTNFSSSSLRLPPLWGKGDLSFLPPFIQKARERELKIIGDGENLAEFLFVENASLLIIKAFEKMLNSNEMSGEAFFLNEGAPQKFWDVLSKVFAIYQVNPPDENVNFNRALRTARIYEKIYNWLGILRPAPPLTLYQVTQQGRSHYFSSEKWCHLIGPSQLISFEDALKKTFSLRDQIKSASKD